MNSRRMARAGTGVFGAIALVAVSWAEKPAGAAPPTVSSQPPRPPAAPATTTGATPNRSVLTTQSRIAPGTAEQILNGLHSGAYGPPLPALTGWVDLHTHPMSYLGFGGKLLYGAPDVNAMLPPVQIPQVPFVRCNANTIAVTKWDALGYENQEYGQPGPSNVCGAPQRALTLHVLASNLNAADYPDSTYGQSGPQLAAASLGFNPVGPDFPTWPAWNDVLRQKMYIDWIHRAYLGGQRVLVALAVNNKLLADVAVGTYPPPFPGQSPGQLPPGFAGQPNLPTDDLSSGNLQLAQMKAMIQRHSDWMQLALTSADLYNAVAHNKLAVILGVELDNIGALTGPQSSQSVLAAVDALYAQGVRYIFPVHLTDNPIGRSAAYQDLFNVANVYEQGSPFNLGCVPGISYVYSQIPAVSILGVVRLGTASPSIPPTALCGTSSPATTTMGSVNIGRGTVQAPEGLIMPVGRDAILHMMSLGMLIDVDHMSQQTVNDTLALAETHFPYAYPLMSGHNSVRMGFQIPSLNTERQLTVDQYYRLRRLHGMVGVGSAHTDSVGWLNNYIGVMNAMRLPLSAAGAAFGTDADGMEFMMPPRPNAPHWIDPNLGLPMDGNKTWFYWQDGVAHYGMLPEFLHDVTTLDVPPANNNGSDTVRGMMGGAQYLFETWFVAEHASRANP